MTPQGCKKQIKMNKVKNEIFNLKTEEEEIEEEIYCEKKNQ